MTRLRLVNGPPCPESHHPTKSVTEVHPMYILQSVAIASLEDKILTAHESSSRTSVYERNDLVVAEQHTLDICGHW